MSKLTKGQQQYVIELIEKGEDLPIDYKHLLFPPERQEYELVYAGKDREEDIIADTMAVPLQPIRSFGTNGDDWHNKLIFGDNLQAMKTLLRMKEEGKLCNADGSRGVRLAYIDPPFATKRDFAGSREEKAYQDKIAGAEFIEFLRKRIVLLRELLADDGNLFVHLDQRKAHYVKVILDEVFGESNFANEIIWRSTNAHNTKTSIGQIHQTILFYRKSDYSVFNPIRRPPFKEYIIKNYRHEDKRGNHSRCDLTGPGTRKGDSGRPWQGYDPTASGRHWQPASSLYDQLNKNISHLPMLKRLDAFNEEGFIYLPPAGGQPRGKLYYNKDKGNLLQDIWAYQPYTSGIYVESDEGIDQDVQWLQISEGSVEYPTQKPEGVLARIIKVASEPGDIVLDAFSGSGTTCAVSEKLGRRWVGIDCGKLAIYSTQKRLLHLTKDIGNKGSFIKGKPFTLYNAGLYDFSKLKSLEWKDWRFFALNLFECRDDPHKIKGVELDGYRRGDDVLIFNHTISGGVVLDYGFVNDIHSQIGSRLGSRFFIIAPAASVAFLEDYIDKGKTRYYILRIPYSIINELHTREFESISQPVDELQVNETIESVGFDFIRQPKVECNYVLKKGREKNPDTAIIKLNTFKSIAMAKGASLKKNRETLSMVFVDYDYPHDPKRKGDAPAPPLDFDEVFYAKDIENMKWQIHIPVDMIKEYVMLVYVDIYGNEYTEIKNISDFKPVTRKKTAKPKRKSK